VTLKLSITSDTAHKGFRAPAFVLALMVGVLPASAAEVRTAERMIQWDIASSKNYSDPFNQVDLDVIFERNGRYLWWEFAPHPEWVTPRGTTLLEPHSQINGFRFGTFEPCAACQMSDPVAQLDERYVAEEWKAKQGTYRLPYAAGISRLVRMIYVPSAALFAPPAPTVLGLESRVRVLALERVPAH